jgi:3-oxoacyl-[acyl-carrier-protein] synthase-3
VDTSDEWVYSRTGIRRRRVLTGESLLDIAERAARRALEKACTAPEELDMIICATLQGDYVMPSTACMVQERLGANCPAFDINAACSGFVYALDVARNYFETRRVRKLLVICAEHLTKFLDWQDRSTCVLFGDGAGAAVLGPGQDVLAMGIKSRARSDCLCIPADTPPCPLAGHSDQKRRSYLSMNGQEVYRFAVSAVTEDIQWALRESGVALEEIDFFVLHQANRRIIEAVRGRLGQPEHKFPVNLPEVGNTSSATIPILLDELRREDRLKPGSIVLLSGFGAGLTSGVCILRWSQ